MKEIEYRRVQYEDSPFQKWRLLLDIDQQELSLQRFEKRSVCFNCGYELKEKDLKNIRSLIRVVDFEKYRSKDESFSDKDITGNYLDETQINFIGISNSRYPLLEIQMGLGHSPKRSYERLYNYLVKNYFSVKILGISGLSEI